MNTESKTVKVTITAADALTGKLEGESKTGTFTEEQFKKRVHELLVVNTTLPEGKEWSYEFEWM